MPGQTYDQAWYYVSSLAGDPETAVMDWRCIHDTDKSVRAETFRGTLPQVWQALCGWNDAGYGVFAVVASMDGAGLRLPNVSYMRAHYVDLDNLSAQQNYERAATCYPAPAFAVQSSPGKYHVYWPVNFYTGNDYFELIQRKLRQVFDGDRKIIDPTRVMRLPGTLHQKNPAAPHLVSMWQLPAYGQRHDVAALADALQSVNVIDGGVGGRHELGDPALAAPSLEWIDQALALADPNDLDRGEWIALTSAIKQAGWSLTDPQTLFDKWSNWCARYAANDPGENLKQWNSIRDTELGWPSMVKRIPSLQANTVFGPAGSRMPSASSNPTQAPVPGETMPIPGPPPLDCSGEYLTHLEQQEWFKGCVFVTNRGDILTPKGRFLNSTQFNAEYGGKKFIIDTTGKMVNEAWQAATRSTLWTIPKVDHTRFIPSLPHGDIIVDELDRAGVNVYRRANIRTLAGDASPFLYHIAALLPDPLDQRILLEYLAYNVRFPGEKIAWAPVIQSTEGAGKGVVKLVMRHAMSRPYFYTPKASELASSGAQFNAWLRNRLFILVDEVKVDERRELIEVLKPLISEEDTEIQGKGVDQELEDNFSNWLFFTNWKDAIPVSKNGRRFSIMYSPLQTAADLIARGMDDAYFTRLYDWLKGDGGAIVTDWLMRYPIALGALPKRAPQTTSTTEAITLSRGPVERMVTEAIEDDLPGFKGGWISATMVAQRIKATGAVRGGSVSPQTIGTVLETMGYVFSGRAARCYFQEDREVRSYLYHYGQAGDVNGYGRAQGWE